MCLLSTCALLLATFLPQSGFGSPEVGSSRAEQCLLDEPESADGVLGPRPVLAAKPELRSQGLGGYLDGRRLLQEGRLQAALRALVLDPDDAFFDRKALLRGHALRRLRLHAEARVAYTDALDHAQLDHVALEAARGLVNTAAALGDYQTQIFFLDALLAEESSPERRIALMRQKAEALAALGRDRSVRRLLQAMLDEDPAGNALEATEKLAQKLRRRGRGPLLSPTRIALAKIDQLIKRGHLRKAEKQLRKLRTGRSSSTRAEVLFRQAEIYALENRRDLEQETLERLKKLDFDPNKQADVLFRLVRFALGRDDNRGALRLIEELRRRHPTSSQAEEAEYLAAWLAYDSGAHRIAHRGMMKFAQDHAHSPQRTSALWFAGWSAYLARDYGAARRAFSTLLDDHPKSTLRPQAKYWLGRLAQREGDEGQARADYHEVVRGAPLDYYGFWAQARLRELGEPVVLPPLVGAPLRSLEAAMDQLGRDRPLTFDRAVVLYGAGLRSDAFQELLAATSFLRRRNKPLGATIVAEVLAVYGADELAFRVGSALTRESPDLVHQNKAGWRAWAHAYPRLFAEEIQAANQHHRVDPDLIIAVVRNESQFLANAMSPVGARGLMQLMPGTAKALGKRSEDARAHAARFLEPDANVWLGTLYLGELLERYSGQMAAAIGAYNAGPSAMDRWLKEYDGVELDEFVERIPYRETRRYVRRVLESYLVYRQLGVREPENLLANVRALRTQETAANF